MTVLFGKEQALPQRFPRQRIQAKGPLFLVCLSGGKRTSCDLNDRRLAPTDFSLPEFPGALGGQVRSNPQAARGI